jgi:hypothetical protein
LYAQNAPITTAATVGGVTGGTVDIPITVTGFINIGAVSLSIDYNYAVLHFTGGTGNPELPSFPSGDLDLGTGYHRISMGWFGDGVTLPDGSVIMTLHFNYTDGISTLNWYDSGPSCEYADGSYNILNDIPTGDYYINGYVCGIVGNPGAISGNSAVCQGQAGEAYSIATIPNATGYNWTVPEGAVITTGQNTNAITVDYSTGAVSGNVSVSGVNNCGSGPSSQLFVTVNALPVADAGFDFTINYGTSTTLHAAPGGSGSFSYHWSPEELLVNPDVQDPQTVILTETTVFTVVVTNQASLCQNSDEVVVTITGGPLSINPVAIPPSICRGESAQLYSNAGGGSGNYTYQWSSSPPGSPPWSSTQANPLVSPDTSTDYLLLVDDGFTVVTGSRGLAVFPLPASTLFGGDTLCGDGVFTSLRVDLTGTPPWSFTYSYGSTSVFVTGQQETPYYIIASEPGDYTITALEDAYCSGTSSGTAIVRKYPIPATPGITVYFSELISSSCCGNQWYKNDSLIPGATGQTYQVTVSGQYTVVVSLNSCSSSPSDPVDMIVGIGELSAGSFSYYPNPATGWVNIQTTMQIGDYLKVSLYSANGILIKEFEVKEEGNIYSVDVSKIASGLYFLMFSVDGIKSAVGGQRSAVGKLIIR